ncbi:cell division protein ZapA [Betaproteobacteria bacterium]|nr:cell division protein ZapA [Betaproteobacteria bacterium]GHU47016.1 cell division protein ZapA [Betaproteobacteria bacterium]
MTDEANFLDVRILGREYRVVCPTGEEDALAAAVRLVDAQMREISDKSKNSTPERVAVMAALNIAHDYLAGQTGAPAGAAKKIETDFDSAGVKRRIEVMETRLAALLEMPNHS